MTTTTFNDGWAVRPKTSIFAELQGSSTGGRPVVLPHDAQLSTLRSESNEGGHNAYFAGGAFEYSKHFEAPLEWAGKRVSVEFEGIYRDAMVYVNGAYAAQRPSGYSGFTVPLDPYLRYGETNTIRVDARAHRDSRWYTGIGIQPDTWLTVTEPVHIMTKGVQITTPTIEADSAIVVVTTVVANESIHTTTVQLETIITGPDGATAATEAAPVTVRAGSSATVRHRVLLRDPRRWDVDTPNLYQAKSRLRDGDTELQENLTSFGIRDVQVDPERGLRLNGTTIKLRGACIHLDNGILGAASFGRAEERRIELLQEAGFNAIRSAHNPLSSALLDACDRVGMLVMDETFDMWAESKSAFDYSLAFPEWWERDIEAMVAKDFNHPSVIFYSIGNEIPEAGTPLGSELGRKLAEKVRSLDPTRLITNGINGFISVLPQVVAMMQQHAGDTNGGVNTLMGSAEDFMGQISASPLVTDGTAESFSVLDVAGLNYGDTRYGMEPELFPHRIVVGTETFPRGIAQNWALVQQYPHVIGDFTWTGWDYLGEVGIGRAQYTDETFSLEAPYPWLSAWCGDIDITGYRRPQSHYREIVFGRRTTPYITVARPQTIGRTASIGQWSWTDGLASWTWDTEQDTPMAVEVYSDAHEVELVVNGAPIGREPAGPAHCYTAHFTAPYVPGTIEAVAYDAAGHKSGRTTLATASEPALEARPDRAHLMADHRDLSFINVEFRDTEGVLATTATANVSVTVDGAGELLALGSARPDNAERFDQPTHGTFDGRLLAIVRPTGAGDIRITVAADGYNAVEVLLTASLPAPPRHRTAATASSIIPTKNGQAL